MTPGVVVLAVWICWPDSAASIPAFARRYEVSCSVCHVAFPKLNSFGIAFRANGYRMPALDERLKKIVDVPLGSEPWKDLWPRAIWPGAIPGELPLALRISLDATVNPDAEAQLDFDMPHEIELLAAGTAGESVSFLAHVDFLGRDDSVKLERVFLQFDSLFDKTLLNIKAGRFEVGAVPFSRFHRRMTATDYLTSGFRTDENSFRFRDSQDGIELWGAHNGAVGGGFQYALGVVNGGGPRRDANGAKDWYFRGSYKIGGFGVTGPRDATSLPLRSTDNWRDDSLRLGTYGYRGEAVAEPTANSFDRYGIDVDLWYRDLNVYGTWYHGREHKGEVGQAGVEAYFVEADYVLFPWLHPLARYEHARGAGRATDNWVIGGVGLIRANLRFVGEVLLFRGDSGDSRARFRLDMGF